MDIHDIFIEFHRLKKKIQNMNGNLDVRNISLVAETDGQTEFPIDLPRFNYLTDFVDVYSGRTRLSPTLDYELHESGVTLYEGVPAGRTVDIRVVSNILTVNGDKVKIKKFPFLLVAETDGQTEFVIPMETFDQNTDMVFVYTGTLNMFEGADFTLSGKKITLTEGVHQGCTVGIYVLKHVIPATGEDFISGVNIEPATIPLDRLAEEVMTKQEVMTMIGEVESELSQI